MAKRGGGFIGQDGINAPDQATGVEASAGDEQASVSFTSPSDEGGAAITGYRVQSNDGIGASGSASPITVTGLTNGTEYSFNVWAINPFGWSSPSDASGSVSPSAPIALFAGGYTGSVDSNAISFVTFGTTGNAADFGDLVSTADIGGGSCASSTRGIFHSFNRFDYVTLPTTGNAADFGDPTVNREDSHGLSSSTRGVFAGGYSGGVLNVIDYVTIATLGNATDFGDLATQMAYGGGCGSSTRGVVGPGSSNSGDTNVIQYITIATTGNAADFGDNDFSSNSADQDMCSNSTRGLLAGGGGGSPRAAVSYITIATTGNATNFGDLTVGRRSLAAAASSTQAVFSGGSDGSNTPYNVIDYMTIASTGNATDFGDLPTPLRGHGSLSNGHGGLQ